MTTQQIAQILVGGRRMVGLGIIFALLAILAAARLNLPALPAPVAVQPVVGQAMTVTGLVFDGTTYRSAPIAVGTRLEQPVVGRAMTVTGLVFDGTR
ncbi:MAG TPA: hypothetical protein VFU22_17540, partial [Roseiflexaceae bacterium]|nr:hypothetical protein [Roseiflexaceae bacterium]